MGVSPSKIVTRENTELRPITDVELVAGKYDKTEFLIDGILPLASFGTLIAGPKVGKSLLIIGIAHAVATGGLVLGNPQLRVQKPRKVLLIGLEDTMSRFSERLEVVQRYDGPSGDLLLANNMSRLSDGALAEIALVLEDNPDIGWVIIDTLTNMKDTSPGTGNAFENDRELYKQFVDFAKLYNIAFTVVHHTRKGEVVDPLESISGSQGLAATADVIWILTRPRMGTTGKFYATGKDVEVEYDLEFNQHVFWQVVGGTHQYNPDRMLSKERTRVLGAFIKNGPMTAAQVGEVLEVPDMNPIYQILSAMSKEGDLIKDGRRYHLAVSQNRLVAVEEA